MIPSLSIQQLLFGSAGGSKSGVEVEISADGLASKDAPIIRVGVCNDPCMQRSPISHDFVASVGRALNPHVPFLFLPLYPLMIGARLAHTDTLGIISHDEWL
jgi:hypothetical protein